MFRLYLVNCWAGISRAAALPIAAALATLQAMGVLVGRLWLPPANPLHSRNIFDQMLSWDGTWYYGIASGGYSWNPALSHSFQSVAFFPLQALIDKAVLLLVTGQVATPVILFISFACGIASIFVFERLARKPIGDAAPTATLLYALWPASSFYLMGYPTGLISICVISAIDAHIRSGFGHLRYGSASVPRQRQPSSSPVLFFGSIMPFDG